MVERAKKKMLYTDLHCSAIDAYLDTKSTDENFDLVVAADVLSYIGDLGSTFDKVKSAVRPGGHFVFTAEAMTTMTVPVVPEKGYKLMQNGRFGYTRRYIDDVIDKTLGEEFQVVMTRDFSPRLDAGDPVAEYLYIVRRQPLI
jgi:predicted TPR repeat methyltransferase